jgi:hypothetical protein
MTTSSNGFKAVLIGVGALALGACTSKGGDSSSQTAATTTADGGYKAPRTSWGDPDLQGIWPGTAMVGVPLQRDQKLGTRNWLTEEEYQAREIQFAKQEEQDNADFDLAHAAETPGGDVGGPVSPPPHWLERGKPQYQASLIVDPPNGRSPPLTDAATERQTALRKEREGRGPSDSYTDRSLYDRCITRALVGSLTPAIYNAGNEIVQSPGYVVIRNEMIHEARIVPLEGQPHVGANIKQWLGDSRGHWDGDTLVVETTNFTDRTNVGGARHSDALKVTERYTRVDADTLELKITIDDPQTWTGPYTLSLPLKRDDSYGMYEYACHEGNLAMFNILSGARADERAAAAKASGAKAR